MVGQPDDVQAVGRLDAGFLVCQHVELAAAGAHLLQVRLELAEQRVVGRDRNHRHVTVHQGEGPVLEFSGRVSLSMDVGELLELERALHRYRVMDAATEEQRILPPGKLPGPGPDLRLDFQHPRQRQRQMP